MERKMDLLFEERIKYKYEFEIKVYRRKKKVDVSIKFESTILIGTNIKLDE